MVSNPDAYVEKFCDMNSDMISFHIEATNHADRLIDVIKNREKAGIVVNPQTPIESIEYLLHKLDYVLLMTVNPGFGGQKFIFEMLKKLKDWIILEKIKNMNF